MKCGEVNRPVVTPPVRSSASMCVTVEPLPFVPPTVTTGHVGLSMPSVRATDPTRASPMSIVLG